MACTPNGSQLCVEMSTDLVDDPLGCDNPLIGWTDYTCQLSILDPQGGDIPTAEQQTFCGSITSLGKAPLKTVALTAVKDRLLSDPTSIFDFLGDQYNDNGGCFWLRWTYCTGGTSDAPAPVAGDEGWCVLVSNLTCPVTGGDSTTPGAIVKVFNLQAVTVPTPYVVP